MGDIFIPPALANADAALSLASSLEVLVDPVKRAKIADDIKAHHALNDTEKKKSEDARALIQKHADILSETQATEARITKAQKELDAQHVQFEAEKETEAHKNVRAKAEAEDLLNKAQFMKQQADQALATSNAKEQEVAKARTENENRTNQLAAYKIQLDKTKEEIEEYRQSVLKMEEKAKAKVSALKQFNF